jgi:hypothetical protein
MAADGLSDVRRIGMYLVEKRDGQNATVEMENNPVLVVGGFLHGRRRRRLARHERQSDDDGGEPAHEPIVCKKRRRGGSKRLSRLWYDPRLADRGRKTRIEK